MVNDIIDKTKDSKSSATQSDSCTSDAKVHANIINEESSLNEPDKISVKLDSKTEKETQKMSVDTKIAEQTKADSNSNVVDTEKDSMLQRKNDKEEIKTNIQDESLNGTDINENTSLIIESTSEKVIESTSDDSGNFSLNESFDNSVSDISKSESDDIDNTEKSKDIIKDKDIEERKASPCKEKTDANMNSDEPGVHDEVFHEPKLSALKSKSDLEDTLVRNCEAKKISKSNVDNAENGERLIGETDKIKADKRDEHPSFSEKVECSTSTSDLDTSKSPVSSSVHTRPYGKDDLVSEPIVSSTQNTQGCQTDDGETENPKPMEVSEKEDDITTSNYDGNRLRIDVSCETENFEADRQMTRESVSVSTDTEELTKDIGQKRKSVDSATSTDIPYKSARRGSVDSGTYTEFQDKLIKPLSPRKLSPHPAGMEAQPLSPAKITLKLSSPPVAVKRPNHSPSRSDPTSSTFLSKFESFVNEQPDTSQDFEPPYTTSPRPSTGTSVASMKSQEVSKAKELDVTKSFIMKPDSSEKKPVTEVTVKRPRGRPPKNKSSETNLVTKHKSNKSRSSSPKYQKYERQKSESYAFSCETDGRLSTSDCSEPKRRKHNSEKSETSSAGQQEERKIPKHFVLFSNGKYTLATENNISKFKQSSPRSPTRTVWDTVLSSYGDKEKHKYSKSAKSNSSVTTKKHEHKVEKSVEKPSKPILLPSQESSQPKLKPLRIVISEPLPVLSKPFNQSIASEDSKKKISSGFKTDCNVSDMSKTAVVSNTKTDFPDTNVKKDGNVSKTVVTTDTKIVSTTNAAKSIPSVTASKSGTSSNSHVTKTETTTNAHKLVSSSNVSKTVTATNVSKTVTATNVSKTVTATNVSKTVTATNVSKTVTAANVSKTRATSNSIPPITVPSLNYNQSKELPSPGDSKPIKTPEYRHQSPFFASLSGAKLTSPHRPSAHLNIPNLNSHFAGTHFLYAQNSYRYTNDRLGCPPYRSLPGLGSAEAKAVGMGIGAVTAKAHRDIATSHSAMMPPFISPLSIPSMLHLPATQTLPYTNSNLIASTKGHSPDSTRSHIQTRPDIHHAFNVTMNTMSNIKSTPKQNSAARKKEKSIDNVISAITEMRAKKEVSLNEQLTGMDLSTKNRNSPMLSDRKAVTLDTCTKDSDKSVEKDKVVTSKASDKTMDKYVFTDDDEIPSKRPSLHVK